VAALGKIAEQADPFVPLPQDPDKITATGSQGILEVSVPVAQPASQEAAASRSAAAARAREFYSRAGEPRRQFSPEQVLV